MPTATPFAELFLACLPPGTLTADRARLEETLGGLIATARAAWPTAKLEAPRFLARLARALPPAPPAAVPAPAPAPPLASLGADATLPAAGLVANATLPAAGLAADATLPAAGLGANATLPAAADPLHALAALQASDLYLAAACEAGDPGALAAFEAALLPGIRAALGQLRFPPEAISELTQSLRAQLFVAREDGLPPMIANYSGRGSLHGWLRIAAVRMAGRWAGKAKREVPLPEEALDAAVLPAEEPGLLRLKETYHAEFKEAFTGALLALSAQERTVLKQHYLDGLSLEELGALYRVHRATVARWLARAREDLLARTREALVGRLAIAPGEFESVLRLIGSRLGFTFREYLG